MKNPQNYLKLVRQCIIESLWTSHQNTSIQIPIVKEALIKKGVRELILDHFAIIDLPGKNSGIPVLSQIFSAIGYRAQGRDYLPDKQNEFLWMTECDSYDESAQHVLPQVVIADFRLDEMPIAVQNIILKYANQTQPSPAAAIQNLAGRVYLNDETAIKPLCKLITDYFSGRDWPLPSLREFETVLAFNALLAWVLIFGRRPNHFTLSVHHMQRFYDLAEFNHFIEHELQLPLNNEGGVIKGSRAVGIAQSSTIEEMQSIQLSDGTIELPKSFIEFAWRFSRLKQPRLWQDFFTGFVAVHADYVIESLYCDEKNRNNFNLI